MLGMESIYSCNVIFPNRRVIPLKAEDLSDTSHTGELLAGVVSLVTSAITSRHLQFG